LCIVQLQIRGFNRGSESALQINRFMTFPLGSVDTNTDLKPQGLGFESRIRQGYLLGFEISGLIMGAAKMKSDKLELNMNLDLNFLKKI
jgi:hypothetical protein